MSESRAAGNEVRGGAAKGTTGCAGASAAEIRSGYWFWGVVIVTILLVELAGALAHWSKAQLRVTIPWTTISGMVGHLEELWPTSAVFVVAIIAPVAFYTLAPARSTPSRGTRRSRLGRRYLGSPPSKDPLAIYNAWFVFALCAAAGVIAVTLFDDDFVRAYVIYGSLFLFGILVPSLLVLVLRRDVSFTSLFCTIATLRERDDWKARLAEVSLSAGLAILVIHLAFYPWPDITKEPVRYAGLTATDARETAVETVMQLRHGATPLVYSTQARQVVNGKEAWAVYFSMADGSDSGCVVIARDKSVDSTPECTR